MTRSKTQLGLDQHKLLMDTYKDYTAAQEALEKSMTELKTKQSELERGEGQYLNQCRKQALEELIESQDQLAEDYKQFNN